MKKIVILFVIACLSFLSSCGNVPGKVFLSYSWLWNPPAYVYDTNPSLPSVIYNNQYYEVTPGTYYIEYISSFNSTYWYMYYTLEADTSRSGVLGTNLPTYYIIIFNDNGIYLQNNESIKSLENNKNLSEGIKVQRVGLSTGKKEKYVGGHTIHQNGYKMTIIYGKLE